jgi:PhnB protein
MTQDVQAIPSAYPGVTPYLSVDGAAAAIEFYKTVFGATERMRMDMPGGKLGHAEIEIGGGLVMLADEYPEMGFVGPRRIGGTPVTLHLYVEDVDAVVARAAQAGAKVLRPPEDQFYGDRLAQLEDPFGHVWNVATHVEDVSAEEMTARMAKHGG